MQEHTEQSSKDLQNQVSQKMGRCIIRLQHYEHLMKKMLTFSELSGDASTIESNLQKRQQTFASMTLGQLRKEFLGEVVKSSDAAPAEDSLPEALIAPELVHMRFKYSMEMDSTKAELLKESLHQLVQLRNKLVHQFTLQFDVFTVAGCNAALSYLDKAYEEIDKHDRVLRVQARGLDDVRRAMGRFLESDAGRN